MNPWFDLVDRLKNREQRLETLQTITDGQLGAREGRDRRLPQERVDALIWGLQHPNAAVRRCCLEVLDQHPDERAIPQIVRCLDDSVPRVRWHAAHALICDVCKPGASNVSAEVIERIRWLTRGDDGAKVRIHQRLHDLRHYLRRTAG